MKDAMILVHFFQANKSHGQKGLSCASYPLFLGYCADKFIGFVWKATGFSLPPVEGATEYWATSRSSSSPAQC
jgi:hypothetical protein